MYGLTTDEWQNLVLSVNTHRARRRLSPIEVARHLRKALEVGSIAEVTESLGFRDQSTVRRFLLLNRLAPELQAVVDWGSKTGKISFSAASELQAVEREAGIRTAFEAALRHSLTKEEARQVKQAFSRGGGSIEECVNAAIKTRLQIERRELILGALTDPHVEDEVGRLQPDARDQLMLRALRSVFPTVKFLGHGLNVGHFSLVLDEDDARALRTALGSRSLEKTITDAIAQCLDKSKSQAGK